MRGNDAIAQILKAEGAEYLFCFPDNQLIHAAAAAARRPPPARTDPATVNMAVRYTRLFTGPRPSCVPSHPGSPVG